MKYVTILLIIFLINCTTGFCQNTTLNKKNNVYLEGAGAFLAGAGIGYERYFHVNPKWKFSLRTGLGAIDHVTKLSYTFGSSLMWGKKSNVEFGLNYLMNYDEFTFRSLDLAESQFKNGVQTTIGYRYQNWNNGMNFRVFYVLPIFCCQSSIPVWSGLSIGYAF